MYAQWLSRVLMAQFSWIPYLVFSFRVTADCITAFVLQLVLQLFCVTTCRLYYSFCITACITAFLCNYLQIVLQLFGIKFVLSTVPQWLKILLLNVFILNIIVTVVWQVKDHLLKSHIKSYMQVQKINHGDNYKGGVLNLYLF